MLKSSSGEQILNGLRRHIRSLAAEGEEAEAEGAAAEEVEEVLQVTMMRKSTAHLSTRNQSGTEVSRKLILMGITTTPYILSHRAQ